MTITKVDASKTNWDKYKNKDTRSNADPDNMSENEWEMFINEHVRANVAYAKNITDAERKEIETELSNRLGGDKLLDKNDFNALVDMINDRLTDTANTNSDVEKGDPKLAKVNAKKFTDHADKNAGGTDFLMDQKDWDSFWAQEVEKNKQFTNISDTEKTAILGIKDSYLTTDDKLIDVKEFGHLVDQINKALATAKDVTIDTAKQSTSSNTGTPPASTPPASTPPADEKPASTPPADEKPASTPPADETPASTPPADKTLAEKANILSYDDNQEQGRKYFAAASDKKFTDEEQEQFVYEAIKVNLAEADLRGKNLPDYIKQLLEHHQGNANLTTKIYKALGLYVKDKNFTQAEVQALHDTINQKRFRDVFESATGMDLKEPSTYAW